MKRQRNQGKALTVFIYCLGLLFLFPLIFTFTNSFMTESAITMNYTSKLTTFDVIEGITSKFMRLMLIPERISLEQYAKALIEQPAFMILLSNSLKITVPVTLGNLLIGLLTGYGFTIWQWKYKEKVFMAYILVMLMPLQAVLVPNYIVATFLRFRHSYLAIMLPGIFSPFGVFLMRQSMRLLPVSCFEAACMDGANHWQVFTRVIIPQLKSAIAALCMLTFIDYWNLVEQAVIFIDDYAKEPLSVYLSRLATGRVGLIFAASCVYLFLPLWFLWSRQQDLEKGIALSGVK
ncbi:MAG: carbohydrate ABC transporter permease [Treponema sp.]|nr:carbohydrate ABC transporter permease [Treponema sp.]